MELRYTASKFTTKDKPSEKKTDRCCSTFPRAQFSLLRGDDGHIEKIGQFTGGT